MQVQKTIKIPIHYQTTEKKLSYLDRLTARLTYAVRQWWRIIEENNLETEPDCSPYESRVQEETRLSSGFVQQARDKALWMKEQWEKSHRKWERKMKKAKKGSKWHEKLKGREPSKPFSSNRSKTKKIPTRFDYRTGEIKEAEIELTDLVARISTLKKHERITILLNPSEYHKEKLEEAEDICSFEIVKHPERKCKWMFHITCRYQVETHAPETIRGVDLGVNRDVASVKLPPTPKNFSLVKTEKLKKLKELDDRIAHLQREEKYEALKKLRRKRRNIAKDHDRKTAKEFAEQTENEIVIVGDPQQIQYHKYRGNGNKRERKMLQHWSFARQGNYITQKCMEKGVIAVRFNEWGTNKCKNCEGELKGRGRRVKCKDCGAEYDREFNSCITLLQKASTYLKNKSSETIKNSQKLAGATDELARTIDDSGLEPWMSMEASFH